MALWWLLSHHGDWVEMTKVTAAKVKKIDRFYR